MLISLHLLNSINNQIMITIFFDSFKNYPLKPLTIGLDKHFVATSSTNISFSLQPCSKTTLRLYAYTNP